MPNYLTCTLIASLVYGVLTTFAQFGYDAFLSGCSVVLVTDYFRFNKMKFVIIDVAICDLVQDAKTIIHLC